jgi:hypothetical protein
MRICACSEMHVVQAKAARLEDDRVDKLPGGANLIACDGKSCSHEVAWPPGKGVCVCFLMYLYTHLACFLPWLTLVLQSWGNTFAAINGNVTN